jgi:hypothetical protein
MTQLEPPPDNALLDKLLDAIRVRAKRDPGDEKVRTDLAIFLFQALAAAGSLT